MSKDLILGLLALFLIPFLLFKLFAELIAEIF
jgi:hypothetical protein